MNPFQRCANLVVYEWRRALAKKKFIVLTILSVALQVLIFLSFFYIFNNPDQGFLDVDALKSTMWLVGVLGPQELFMPLIAIMVAGGSMSEEYEHGTADILLSKPISKIEYLIGKYLGGFSISIFVIALSTGTGIMLAYGLFGLQESLLFAPIVYLSLIYANLVFFSLSFMLSEVLRRTSLAILTTVGAFVASFILEFYLSIMFAVTQDSLYLNISKVLPNWSVANFPSFVVSKFITVVDNPFLSVPSGDLPTTAAIIAVYGIICITAAAIRLVRSDIAKKAL